MTPDAALRLYFHLDDPAPPAIDLVAWTGRIYDPECPKCGSSARYTRTTKRGSYVEACECGAIWPWEDRHVLRGAIDHIPRRIEPEPSFRAGLGAVIWGLWRSQRSFYQTRAFYAYALRLEGCRTYRDLSRALLVRWPKASGFSLSTTFRLVNGGRAELGSRLEAAGLFQSVEIPAAQALEKLPA